MRRLPAAAFAALMVLTVAAFFITQHLKTVLPAVVAYGHSPGAINPISGGICRLNDGQRVSYRRTRLTFQLSGSSDTVGVYVANSHNQIVATLTSGRRLQKMQQNVWFTWNGRNAAGHVVPDGTYYFRVTLQHEDHTQQLNDNPVQVITKPPVPKITSVRVTGTSRKQAASTGAVVIRPGAQSVTIHFKPDNYRGAEILIYRSNTHGDLKLVQSFLTSPKRGSDVWKGRLANGKLAPPGTYVVGLRVKDQACNLGTTPATTSVAPGMTAGTGVTVRYLAALPPLNPTPAGSRAIVYVDSRDQAYRWVLRAAGSAHVLEHGSKHAGTNRLLVHMPAGQPGLYALTVTAHGRSTVVPLIASGAHREAQSKVLVVLPMLTWEGQDPLDQTGDGIPDTLSNHSPVTLPRLLIGGLPAGFGDEAKLLRYLNDAHVDYQLTTDVALATGQTKLSGHSGVLFAGSLAWLPARLDSQLHDFVHSGAAAAVIGLNSMEAEAELHVQAGGLIQASPPTALHVDPFGARRGVVSSTGGLLVTRLTDQLGLLGSIPALQGFHTYQEISPPNGVRVSLAGVAQEAPAVTAFKLGSGKVVEVGLDGFARSLASNVDSQELMNSIWHLLR